MISSLFDKTATLTRPAPDGMGGVTYSTISSTLPISFVGGFQDMSAPPTANVSANTTIYAGDATGTLTGGIRIGDRVTYSTAVYEVMTVTSYNNGRLGAQVVYTLNAMRIFYP